MIEFIDLNKNFGNTQVLKGINKTFETNRIHGIIGLNGAGKTTLFNCMAGIMKYKGSIISDGNEKNLDQKTISLLPTHSYFFPRSTGEEYLRFIAYAKGISAKAITPFNIFNLPLKKFIAEYSTGMQKKLAFSGILMGNYELYIFDEPFNGVDLQSNLILKRILQRLKQKGKTIFISSHILSSLTDLCDTIHLLSNGQITTSFTQNEFDQIENKLLTVIN